MPLRTIAVHSPGEMGHGVGAVLRGRGYRVVAALEGRSAETRARGERVGIENVGSVDAILDDADLVLSILPPASAEEEAARFGRAAAGTERRPLYVDANAVAPETARRIEKQLGPLPFVADRTHKRGSGNRLSVKSVRGEPLRPSTPLGGSS